MEDSILIIGNIFKETNQFNLLWALAIGITLFLLIMFIDLFSHSLRIRRIAKHVLVTQTKALEILENQFSIIQSHAPTYINSLAESGTKQLSAVSQTLGKRRDYLELVSELLALRDLTELEEVLSSENLDESWIKETKVHIYELGKKILEASKRASMAGVPKPSSRSENTYLSLTKAKIISKKDSWQ